MSRPDLNLLRWAGLRLQAACLVHSEKIAKYEIRPANEHEFTVLCEMNREWSSYGGPKQIGDKSYQSQTCLMPPRVNARRVDPRWRAEYGAARKCVESTFSVLAGDGLRWGQVKTYLSLRLKVALNILAHNLEIIDISG